MASRANKGRGKVWFQKRQNLTRKILQFCLLSGIVVLAIYLHGLAWAVMVGLIAIYLEVK
jgi:hypothetical protein